VTAWDQYKKEQSKPKPPKLKPLANKKLTEWEQYENKIKDIELQESPLGGG
jgi:hypothetical protein